MKKAIARRDVTDKFRAPSAKSTHTRQKPVRSMPASCGTVRERQVKGQPPYRLMCGYKDQGGKDRGM